MCMRRLGLKVFYLPEVRVIHHVGRRLQDEPAAKRATTTVAPRRSAPRCRRAPRKRDHPAAEPGPPAQGEVGRGCSTTTPTGAEVGLGHAQPRHGRRAASAGADTEVCWRYDDALRAAGEEILEASVRVGVPIISTNEGELLRHTLPRCWPRTTSRWWCSTTPRPTRPPRWPPSWACAACASTSATRSAAADERRAARASDGEAVLFVQPDCFLSPGFVAAARGAPGRPRRGLGGAEAGPHRGPGARAAAGRDGHRRHVAGPPAQERPGGPRRARRWASTPPAEAFGADGAVALYRRAALEDAARGRPGVRRGPGQFARRPADWASDADLAWRVRLLGWRCVYEPGAVAYHIRRYSPSTRGRDARVGPDGAVPQPLPDDGQERPARRRWLRDLPRIAALRGPGAGLRPAARALPAARLRGGRARASRACCAKRRVLQRRRRARGAVAPPYGLVPPA